MIKVNNSLGILLYPACYNPKNTEELITDLKKLDKDIWKFTKHKTKEKLISLKVENNKLKINYQKRWKFINKKERKEILELQHRICLGFQKIKKIHLQILEENAALSAPLPLSPRDKSSGKPLYEEF